MHGFVNMIVNKTDNMLLKLLETSYKRHKEIASSIANIVENHLGGIKKKETNTNTLESYMGELIKNTSRYNAATRFINIRNKIYETSIRGR